MKMNRRMYSAVSVILLAIMVSACEAPRLANSPKSAWFDFQHQRYWTTAAHQAFVGTVGLKGRFKRNYFQLKTQPVWDDVDIAQTAAMAIDAAASRNITLGVDSGSLLSQVGNVSASVSSESSSTNQGSFRIFQLLDLWEVRDQLNGPQNSALRNQLASDADYRIVTVTASVFGHQYNQTLNRSGGLSMTMNKLAKVAPTINVSGGGGRDEKLSYSDGTRVAYQMSRFCWIKDAVMPENVRIYEIVPDMPGNDRCECPAASYFDPLVVSSSSEGDILAMKAKETLAGLCY